MMLSSAYSNMIHANITVPPSVSKANKSVSPSVSDASIIVSPSLSDASIDVSPSISEVSTSVSNATIPNVFSYFPRNFQDARYFF